jgi:quinol monooxygenase YgiN
MARCEGRRLRPPDPAARPAVADSSKEDPMLHVVATLPIKPDKTAEFEALFADLARQVRDNEKGCERYELCKSTVNPATYVVVERYSDQAALGEHSKTPYFLAFMGKVGEFVAGAPQIDVLTSAR